jgi:ATP-dependent DNA helicase PIF1
LPEPVFSHGQLYVALSRSTARKNVKILVIPDGDNKKTSSDESKKKRHPVNTYTKNIVWKEILTS